MSGCATWMLVVLPLSVEMQLFLHQNHDHHEQRTHLSWSSCLKVFHAYRNLPPNLLSKRGVTVFSFSDSWSRHIRRANEATRPTDLMLVVLWYNERTHAFQYNKDNLSKGLPNHPRWPMATSCDRTQCCVCEVTGTNFWEPALGTHPYRKAEHAQPPSTPNDIPANPRLPRAIDFAIWKSHTELGNTSTDASMDDAPSTNQTTKLQLLRLFCPYCCLGFQLLQDVEFSAPPWFCQDHFFDESIAWKQLQGHTQQNPGKLQHCDSASTVLRSRYHCWSCHPAWQDDNKLRCCEANLGSCISCKKFQSNAPGPLNSAVACFLPVSHPSLHPQAKPRANRGVWSFSPRLLRCLPLKLQSLSRFFPQRI